ncbi:hypothetical protein E2562_038586 [Oryza meyeriana var. granulata]|uniref:Uncharacterized protein n=1 Tax=Oryza meyeriana var. granulata TaxID=110450 RepID=A0A6G1DSY9_9ORYZ|nr:hypothetical protein E2562_038586 [Oryza meyeriana var. granulata]
MAITGSLASVTRDSVAAAARRHRPLLAPCECTAGPHPARVQPGVAPTRLLPDDEDGDTASPSTPHASAPAQVEKEGEEAEQQGKASELAFASLPPPPSRLARSWS